MSRIQLAFLAISLLPLLSLQWSPPQVIAREPQDCIGLRDLAKDPAGNLHVLYQSYSRNTTGMMHYLKLSPLGAVLASHTIPVPYALYGVVKAGPASVYVTVATDVANETIYFTENPKSGMGSWTTPLRLHPAGRASIRSRPQMVLIAETGRLYVFYKKYDLGTRVDTVVMVTRAAGSRTFSVEREIYLGDPNVFTVGYTMSGKGKSPWLHMFALGDYKLNYTSSANGGVTWTNTRTIISEDNDQLADLVKVGLVSTRLQESDIAPTMFITYGGLVRNAHRYRIKMRSSKDLGLTWSNETASKTDVIFMVVWRPQNSVSLAGNSRIMNFVQKDANTFGYIQWRIQRNGTVAAEEREQPFDGKDSDGALAELVDGGKMLALVSDNVGACSSGNLLFSVDEIKSDVSA